MKRDLVLRGYVKRKSATPSLRLLLYPSVVVVTLGGAGFSPIAPGTVGTLLAFPLVYLCSPLAPTTKILFYVILALIALWAISRAGPLLRDHDHSAVIIDETLAMALVLEFLPRGLSSIVAGFILFRLFDVLKPWPANIVEARVRNGFGVLGDDLLVAAYSITVVWACVALAGLIP